MKRSQPVLLKSLKFLKTIQWIICAGLLVSLGGCGPFYHTYKFSMEESQKRRKPYYQNDTFSIAFNFHLKGLVMDFTNKLNENIIIKWDELRMAENEMNKEIKHISFRSLEEGNIITFQPPPIISPKSNRSDFVVYADNIYSVKEDGEKIMKIKDMYPIMGDKRNRDSVQGLIGQKITLHFPIEINKVSRSWNFIFLLADVRSERAITVFDVYDIISFIPELEL